MTAPVQQCQPDIVAFPAPWKSTNAVKASNFGSVAARVTSMTPDPANPGQMTQVTIAKVFGGLQDDPQTAKDLAARIAEAVNSHAALHQSCEELGDMVKARDAQLFVAERDAAALQARVDELEAQLAKSCDDTRFADSDAGCPRAFKAEARVEQTEGALRAIMKATVEGRVCDDVAWFDTITTLHDFCDLVLNGPDADEGPAMPLEDQ